MPAAKGKMGKSQEKKKNGSRKPEVRQQAPEYDVQKLETDLHEYVKNVGILKCFVLGIYQGICNGQAVRGLGIVALIPLISVFLATSPFLLYKLVESGSISFLTLTFFCASFLTQVDKPSSHYFFGQPAHPGPEACLEGDGSAL
jgi:hypothetical protein